MLDATSKFTLLGLQTKVASDNDEVKSLAILQLKLNQKNKKINLKRSN